jgi:hypothetical protein
LGLGVVHKSLCLVSRRYPRSGNKGFKVGTLRGGHLRQNVGSLNQRLDDQIRAKRKAPDCFQSLPGQV